MGTSLLFCFAFTFANSHMLLVSQSSRMSPPNLRRHRMPSINIYDYGDRLDDIDTAKRVIQSYVRSFQLYDYQQAFENAREKHPGTCEWLMAHPDFLWWQAGDSPTLLWLSGGPGRGKSTLLAHVIDVQKQKQKSDSTKHNGAATIFSFCDSERNKTSSTVLAVAVHQLLETFPHLQEWVFYHDQTHSWVQASPVYAQSIKRPTVKLWQLLTSFIEKTGLGMIFLIVDALDELDPESQRELIRLFSHPTSKIKILVSSRPIETIRIEFSRWSNLATRQYHQLDADAQEDIDKDVDSFTKAELNRVVELRGYSSAQASQIWDHLMNDQSKLFLTPKLILRKLEATPAENLDQSLKETSTDLYPLYERLLNDINPTLRSKPSEVLKYLTYAHEPLSIVQLASACSSASNALNPFSDLDSDTTSNRLQAFRHDLRLYGPIIRVYEKDALVGFIHSSAKEFLIKRLERVDPSDRLLVPSARAQQEIAIACLRLLISFSPLRWPSPFASKYTVDIANVRNKHCLLHYALKFWHKHLRDASRDVQKVEELDSQLVELIRKLMNIWKNPEMLDFRHNLLAHTGQFYLASNHAYTVFEYFSALGLNALLQDILVRQPSQQLVEYKESALSLAIRNGNDITFSIIRNHFQLSLDIPVFVSALADATSSGNTELIRKVLRLRRQDPSEIAAAIKTAFARGDGDSLEALTEDPRVLSATDEWEMTVLHRVFFDNFRAEKFHEILAAASYFVGRGISLFTKDKFGNTPFHYASWCTTRSEIINLLLRHGADPGEANIFGWTPLHLAAKYAYDEEVIDTIITTGGTSLINGRSGGDSTPLHWAAQRLPTSPGSEDVIRSLLRHGADPYAVNRQGVIALQVAREAQMLPAFQDVYTGIDGWDYPSTATAGRIMGPESAGEDEAANEDETSIQPITKPAAANENQVQSYSLRDPRTDQRSDSDSSSSSEYKTRLRNRDWYDSIHRRYVSFRRRAGGLRRRHGALKQKEEGTETTRPVPTAGTGSILREDATPGKIYSEPELIEEASAADQSEDEVFYTPGNSGVFSN